MSYRVRTDNFEGPFDILLYLVSRQRVDIGSINIAVIADQYLEEISHMRMIDLDVASDFLLVASTLLEIKAASLVPRDRDVIEEEVAELAPNEARDILVTRLLEYKKYKNAAAMLEGRGAAQALMHPRTFGPDPEFMQSMPDFLRNVPLEVLAHLAVEALARKEVELLESDHIAAKPIPLEVHVRSLHANILSRKHLWFSELVDEKTPPPLVVVTFLAVLELYKRSMVNVRQEEQFGDIEINYIEGSGDLVFDEEDAEDIEGVEDAEGAARFGGAGTGGAFDGASDSVNPFNVETTG